MHFLRSYFRITASNPSIASAFFWVGGEANRIPRYTPNPELISSLAAHNATFCRLAAFARPHEMALRRGRPIRWDLHSAPIGTCPLSDSVGSADTQAISRGLHACPQWLPCECIRATKCTVAMHVPGQAECWSRFLTPHPTVLNTRKIVLLDVHLQVEVTSRWCVNHRGRCVRLFLQFNGRATPCPSFNCEVEGLRLTVHSVSVYDLQLWLGSRRGSLRRSAP